MSEEKVGALTLRHGAPNDGENPYRDLRAGQLEIRKGAGTIEPASGPGPIMGLVILLGGGLLVFAVIVRSIPAMATVGFALSAMAWLVIRRRVRKDPGGFVAVGPEGVRVVTPARTLTTAIDDVEAVGLGENGATRTLWLQVRSEGRVLVFDGLDELEAKSAVVALEEAIERRRQASSAPRASLSS